ncbi:MAG: YggT family protein [Actinomycetes bacterium]
MIVHQVIKGYILILVLRALVSWIPATTQLGPTARQLLATLFKLTEPVLRPIRNLISPLRVGGMGVDFSIFVAIIALQLINGFIR